MWLSALNGFWQVLLAGLLLGSGLPILFALGEGAVIPLLPVLATKMGADLAVSSLVVTALVIGQLCGVLPRCPVAFVAGIGPQVVAVRGKVQPSGRGGKAAGKQVLETHRVTPIRSP